MKTIDQEYTIEAPRSSVWQALVDPKVIDEWGGGPAEMDDKEGTKFSLWGGDIHGANTEVNHEHKLSQLWYGGAWTEPSHLTITLLEEGSKTIIKIHHTDVPDDEVQDIAQGWDDFYFGPMKTLLEKS